ncbi:hypothetical protein OESDEN_10926 [Oesophagostomum dentatum]|uniref:Bestrophin homolog n=1 Tax=Oesophagostomum dentatum TaxID=61180 RepID=A0A0B1T0G5_OESDE|nr:hypothetical protein OESDEN_10926 [Oesophagostomum dentatum]
MNRELPSMIHLKRNQILKFLRSTESKSNFIYQNFVDKQLFSRVFEDLCIFFDQHSSFIPVTFMLGFYVSAVYNRWWQVFDNMGWIDQ